MPQRRLTPTSYAVLGLLDIQSWSTYELTKQMQRTFHHVWPRAESNLYQEPQRLVKVGYATARKVLVGKRTRTEYSITDAGRVALREWLREPAAPTVIGSETMIKVLFGDSMPVEDLERHIRTFGSEAEATDRTWRAVAREYLDGQGPFPERAHVNTLYWVLLDRWARLRADWAEWAAAEVATWPDSRGPADREQVVALLRRALDDDDGLLPDRPSAQGSATG
jgi:DNA-binding PadR family transcriptional regulator